MNKIATMEVGQCLHAPTSWFVALRYRGKDIKVWAGKKDEIGTMQQAAHACAIAQGFTNTRTVYLPRI